MFVLILLYVLFFRSEETPICERENSPLSSIIYELLFLWLSHNCASLVPIQCFIRLFGAESRAYISVVDVGPRRTLFVFPSSSIVFLFGYLASEPEV